MQTFTTLTAPAAPLLIENIDTDLIIPKQFLKTIQRAGLGRHLFHDLRFHPDGREREDFVLNREPGRRAGILLAGANFGCGSSREHAPWALADFGIRCVIAPSFADIFYNNCFKNGLLPLSLPAAVIEELAGSREPLTVDLVAQEVRGSRVHRFELEAWRRTVLLEGLDEIGVTEQRLPAIAAFEAQRRSSQPWL